MINTPFASLLKYPIVIFFTVCFTPWFPVVQAETLTTQVPAIANHRSLEVKLDRYDRRLNRLIIRIQASLAESKQANSHHIHLLKKKYRRALRKRDSLIHQLDSESALKNRCSPRIDSISPTSGTNKGGTAVAIRGCFKRAIRIEVGSRRLSARVKLAKDLVIGISPSGSVGFANVSLRHRRTKKILYNVQDGFEYVQTSPAPTPTATSTETPTSTPTANPTTTPIESPSSSPTASPTPTVTMSPTASPTPSETVFPNERYSNVRISTSQSTGVAPLGIFFDAISTTSDRLTWNDIEEGHFVWDFGDGTGSAGYMAAKVYNTPGVYNARLSVYHAGSLVRTTNHQITVNTFNGTTCYVSSSTGNDHNSGLSPSLPLQTFAEAASRCGKSNHRILFQRGDSWSVSNGVHVEGFTNFHIGAYGSGNLPFFDWAMMQRWESLFSGSCSKSSFQDFAIRGRYSNSLAMYPGNGLQLAHSTDIVVQRVHARDLDTFTETGVGARGLIFKEIDFDNFDGYGHYGEDGSSFAVLDSFYGFSDGEHDLRFQGGSKVLVQGSSFSNPGSKTELTYRGNFEYGLSRENTFRMTVGYNPQNETSEEYQTKIIHERNLHTLSAGLVIKAREVIVRNNIFLNGPWITLDGHSLSGDPADVKIYGNTIYKDGDDATIGYFPRVNGLVVVNNAFWSSSNIGYNTVYYISDALNLNQSLIDYNVHWMPNNSGGFLWYQNQDTSFERWQGVYGQELHGYHADPEILVLPNGDVTLSSTSPARDNGLPMAGLYEDFYGTPRSFDSPDIGAVEVN